MKKFFVILTLLLCVTIGAGAASSPTAATTLYKISDCITYRFVDEKDTYEYANMVFSILEENDISFEDVVIDDAFIITYDGSERFPVFELPHLYEPEDKAYAVLIEESTYLLYGKVLEGGAIMFDFEEIPTDTELIMFIMFQPA